ncbi:hypothetical protein JOC54_000277 [Alkalihalobacillus xiaoxiensis]|uniref:Uncharacterized protein n=1 Tax=Shouchella xiaoxiensis TaxID=766895 RepID=A0ABS2SPF8_9BACI|nr:hypothetical protein [Shouchella xiaoxiensis]MBM7837046.1 hypothetical protein [Shouchella xiaoxiensis]
MTNEGENPQQPNGEDNGNNEEPVEQDLGKAAEDEFTSKFLVSTEEEEEGFYRMRGELGGFEMLMPKDAVMGEMFHKVENNAVEEVEYSQPDEENNRRLSVFTVYISRYPQDQKDNYLESFKQEIGFTGEFDLKETDSNEIYKGKLTNEEIDDKPFHVFFAYTFSKDGNEAISLRYSIACIDENQCELQLNNEEKYFNQLVESINFTDKG